MNHKVILQRQWFIGSKTTDINNDYVIGRTLGSGAYGKVFLAQNRISSVLRAIKVILKNRVQDYETFINEINILKKLDHPNIVNIIESYENERVCFLVLENCTGGELFERITKLVHFSEQQAAVIMKQIISAVAYCHNFNIIHRDLKPDNCLYITEDDNSELKVIDFGLSAEINENEILHDIRGTPYYMAPEILSRNYSKVVDCWSLGVIMYTLLTGTPPFNGKDNNEILMNIYNGYVSFRHNSFKQISDYAKDLICRFLTKDPNYRITAQQSYDHPWVQGLVATPQRPLPLNILDSISKFVNASTLKKATLMFIASKLTEKDIMLLREHFKRIDVNGDGVINKAELGNILRENSEINQGNADAFFAALDLNSNEIIDYTEFLTGCLLRSSFSTTGFLLSAFMYFDVDCSGFITDHDIRRVLQGGEVINHLSSEEIDKIITEFDKNSDGFIDYKEFIECMSQKNLIYPRG